MGEVRTDLPQPGTSRPQHDDAHDLKPELQEEDPRLHAQLSLLAGDGEGFQGADRWWADRILSDWEGIRKVAASTAKRSTGRRLRRKQENGEVVLGIRNLSKYLRPRKPVLAQHHGRQSHRAVSPAIIGPSGNRQVTLIRCINRLVEPTEGEIVFEGQDIAHLHGQALRAVRRKLGMVFQEYNLVERLSVMENLLTGRLGYTSAWNSFLRKFEQADIEHAYSCSSMSASPISRTHAPMRSPADNGSGSESPAH
jgi:ABC-type glutathione transport system ATPase component